MLLLDGGGRLGLRGWNEIPPALFAKGGKTPASSYSLFNKGGWGDFNSDLLRNLHGPAPARVPR